MKHRARKRFGQNFLKDEAIIQKIVNSIAPEKKDFLIEIGPGKGALTIPLAQRVNRMYAIEIDWDLQNYLRKLPELAGKLELICDDALQVDFRQWGNPLRIVGNLPYNISTPLLLHLLNFVAVIDDMHFMLQKEVVQRMAAAPGGKSYGRLSVICQYYCSVEHLFNVPAYCFEPEPKVESAIVRLTPHRSPVYPKVDRKALESITAKGFSMRRKTLANNLKGVLSADQLINLGLDPKLRPEQISVADWVRLALVIKSGKFDNESV